MDEIKIENLKMLRIYLKENDWRRVLIHTNSLLKNSKNMASQELRYLRGFADMEKEALLKLI